MLSWKKLWEDVEIKTSNFKTDKWRLEKIMVFDNFDAT